MSPRDNDQKIRRKRRSHSAGFVRMPQRRRRKPNPATRTALLILIALLLAGAIVRRVLMPSNLIGYSSRNPYRHLSPGEGLTPDDNRTLNNTIGHRSQ